MLAIVIIAVLCLALVIMYKKYVTAEKRNQDAIAATRLAYHNQLFQIARRELNAAQTALQAVALAHTALEQEFMSG